MKKVLIVIDYQNDFVCGALGFDAAARLENGIVALTAQALAEGTRVLFTRDTHTADYLSTREGRFLPVTHCIESSEGWHLYGALRRYEDDARVTIVNKPGFGSMTLPNVLQAQGTPDEIILCGVVTNICVLSNAVILQNSFANAKITVKKDLCAAPGSAHEQALTLLRGLGITVE